MFIRATAIVLLVLAGAPTIVSANEAVSTIRVQPKDATPKKDGFLNAGRAKDIIRIEILDVENLNGNNPTSTIDPVAAEDPERAGIENDDGDDGNNVGLQACLGTFPMLEDLAGAGAGLFFASLDIDANTGDCQARSDSNGQALVAQFDNTVIPPGNAQFFSFGVFNFDPPPNNRAAPLGTPITITTVAATGLRVTVTVVVNGAGAVFNLTVVNIAEG